MKQTKTTLKELTAAYRAVLRHGILCNAIALGLIAATPAMAETPTARQVLSSGDELILNEITADMIDSGSAYGAVYYIDNNTNVKINDSVFSNNKAATSGAVEMKTGALTVNNSKFKNNVATTSSGAIETWTRDSVLKINNSTFEGNTGKAFGAIGAFGLENTITDSSFIGNHANRSDELQKASMGGGALGIGSSAHVLINKTENGTALFENNTSSTQGGAIDTRHFAAGDNHASTLDIIGATFRGNQAGVDYNIATGEITQSSYGADVRIGGAINNTLYNSANHEGAVYVADSQFESNSAANGGAIYNNVAKDGDMLNAGEKQVGSMYLTDSTFTGNTASEQGGALYNAGIVNIDNGTFKNNSATEGGAMFMLAEGLTSSISNSTFENNTALNGDVGGAITLARGTLNIDNTTFKGNEADWSGAIFTYSAGNTLNITDSTFDSNKARGAGAVQAMFNTNISDTTFKNNIATTDADGGGALFVGAMGKAVLDNVTFTENEAGYRGGAVSTRSADLADNSAAKLDILNSIFTGNTSGTTGGALDNFMYSSNADETAVYIDKTAFTSNEAVQGGAIYNHGEADKAGNIASMKIVDSSFTNNIASGKGGALYNSEHAGMTVESKDGDVVFEGNTANGVANDIYNAGTLALNAASGRTISLAGGIDGAAGILNIVGNGLVETSTIKNQTVTHNAGELHLTNGAADGSNISGSTVNVVSGATLNSIDSVANNYANITLADGANVELDADFNAGGAYDQYSINNGATINVTGLSLLNALNSASIGERSLQIASNNVGNINLAESVKKSVKAYTSEAAYGIKGNDVNNGTISMYQTGASTGFDIAVNDTDTNNKSEVIYDITAAAGETFTSGDKTIKNADFVVHGNDKDITATAGVASIVVKEDSTLTMDNATLKSFEGAAIDNAGEVTLSNVTFAANNAKAIKNTGTMRVFNSNVLADVDTSGVFVSDPSTYSGTVTNTGVASFDEDTFTDTAVLANSGTADLMNGVKFELGAAITGDGVLNLVDGTTAFNNTASSNTINVASGADWSGALANTGVVNTQNNAIDTITGSVTGGDLRVDANLVSGKIDSFGGTTGANVKGIKLANAGYGTENTVSLEVGGATLDSNLDIVGTNYYTSVTKDGDNIVFSDKLINESNLDTKLGSWENGNYIKNSTNMTTAADATHLTVGSALSALDTAIGDMSGFGSQNYAKNTGSVAANLTALDTQLKTVSTAGTIASGQTGFVTGDAVNTALSAKQAAITNSDTIVADGTGLKVKDASIGATQLASGVQSSLDAADSAIQTVKVNGTALTASGNTVDILVAQGSTNGTISVNGADVAVKGLGTTAYTNKAAAFTPNWTDYTDDDIYAWVDANGANVADVTTTNLVLTKKLSTVYHDLFANGDNAGSIAHALGANTAISAEQQVKNLITWNAAAANYNASGTYADGTIGKAIQTNAANIATNTTDIATNATNIANIVNGTTVVAEATKATQDGAGNVIADTYATKEEVTSGVTAVYNQAHEWAENLLGVDVDSNVNNQLQTALGDLATADETTNTIESKTIAGALHELDTDVQAENARALAAEGNLNTAITNITNGTTYTEAMEGNVQGTIATALANGGDAYQTASDVKANAENADFTKSEGNASSASLGSATTIGGAINNIAAATDTNTTNIATNAENIANIVNGTTVVGKAYADEDGNNIKTTYATKEEVTSGVTAVYNQAHEWAENLLGVDVDANVNNQLQTALGDLATADETTNTIASTTIAGALHELDTDVQAENARALAAEGELNTAITNITNGTTYTEAMEAKVQGTIANNAENATFTGTKVAGSSSATVGGALSATNTQVNTITTSMGDVNYKDETASTTTSFLKIGETAATNTVRGALDVLDGAVSKHEDILGDMSTVSGTYVSSEKTVAENLNQLSAAIDSIGGGASIAQANAYTDQRVESLDKNLSAGVAGAVALSSVAVSGVERGEVSVGAGYGYFNGQSAAAFGAAVGLSNRWSINAGAGVSNADVSFRAGTNYKFKLF